MTIEDFSSRIVEKLKSLPDEAKQKGKESEFKCFWDEYKEQLQYQLYPNYDIFEEDIESMAYDEIIELSDDVIRLMYNSIKSSYNPHKYIPVWELTPDCYSSPASFEERKSHIVETILLNIQTQATSEKVEYTKPYIGFIKYMEDEITVVAEVFEKLSPWEYSIHTYSPVADPEGKQEIVHLPNLKKYNGLERITIEEFVREKNSFKAKRLSTADADHENERQSLNLLNTEYQSDNLAKRIDQYHDPINKTEKDNTEEKKRLTKALVSLVNLLAKAQNRSPQEILSKMNQELKKRRDQKETPQR